MKSRFVALLPIVVLSILFDLLILPTLWSPVEMQSGCPPVQPTEIQHPSWDCWQANAQVRYFFTNAPGVRAFTDTEKTLYREAFAVWNTHSFPGNNCSGVYFSENSGTQTFEYVKCQIPCLGLRIFIEVLAALAAAAITCKELC